MPDSPAYKRVSGTNPRQPVTPKNEDQMAVRQRRIDDALEDDEVHEALVLLRAHEKAKASD